MSIRNFLESSIRLIKMINRPDIKELQASIRISLIGLAILGALGFIIKFLATLVTPTA